MSEKTAPTKTQWHLSRFIRPVRGAERADCIESLVSEQRLVLDPLLLDLLQVLARGPRGEVELFGALEPRHPQLSAQVLRGRLGLLADACIAQPQPDRDEALLFTQLDDGVPELPLVDLVEVTNHCGLSCIMCAEGLGLPRRAKGFIEVELFARLLEQVLIGPPRPKPLTLHNLGEPLLHPRLAELVGAATARGVPTELSTNAGLLTAARYRELRDAGLQRLVIALDGLDRETLEAVRGPAARADQAFDNLEQILAARAREGESLPEIIVQMVRMAHNAHQHAAFLARFRDSRLPGVRGFLKPLDAVSPPDLFVPGEQARPFLCRAPWRSVVVFWDGRVSACCYDWHGQLVLGDLRTQSLAEVWRSDPIRRLRERLRRGASTPEDACFTCPYRLDSYVRPPLDEFVVDPLQW